MNQRLALCLLAPAAIAAAVFVACGGATKIDIGYVDDAGLYHDDDGAVLFTPASKCIGFDASIVPPLCTQPISTSSPDGYNDPACVAWSDQLAPPTFPPEVAACKLDNSNMPDGGAHCLLSDGNYTDNYEPCPVVGAGGDQFCSGWAQQFVTSGHAFSHCQLYFGRVDSGAPVCMVLGTVCPDGTSCATNEICVTTNGSTYRCTRPCGP